MAKQEKNITKKMDVEKVHSKIEDLFLTKMPRVLGID